MKISVYIPSIPRSFDNLKNIIDIYNSGTLVPDEIVIHASDVGSKESVAALTKLKKLEYPNVKIYAHKLLVSAGKNREMTLELTTGDLIIYQDDDDLPSKRRVEIIKYFFDNHDIVALNHGIFFNKPLVEIPDSVDLNSIRYVTSDELTKRYLPFGELADVWRYSKWYGIEFGIQIGTGVVSVKREVLNEVHWKDLHEISLCGKEDGTGEDYDFCMETLHKFNKSMLINAPLYEYKFDVSKLKR